MLSFLLQIEPTSGAVDSIVTNLSHEGPLVSLFILICLYLVWQIKKKDENIVTLNEYIRESDKENAEILSEVNNTLDRVLENQRNTNEVVIKEISSLKEFLLLKFGH